MRRIEVAAGVFMYDREAGIGDERYVPPNPMSRTGAPTIIVGAGVEESHRQWVEEQAWKVAGSAAVVAAIQEAQPSSS